MIIARVKRVSDGVRRVQGETVQLTDKLLVAKDPFLADYRANLQEAVEGLKSVGGRGLRLLIVEMIRSRWIRDKRASYPYEVAWVLERKEEVVARMMKELTDAGDIEHVGISRGKNEQVRPYRPRTLRKATPSR
jgi:hypothetical protein